MSQVEFGVQVPNNVEQEYKFGTPMLIDRKCTIHAFILCIDNICGYTMQEGIIK